MVLRWLGLLLGFGCLVLAQASTRPPVPDWKQDGSNAWYEGALLGNGDLGVVVYGASDELTFGVGKNDLWDRRAAFKFYKPVPYQSMMDVPALVF